VAASALVTAAAANDLNRGSGRCTPFKACTCQRRTATHLASTRLEAARLLSGLEFSGCADLDALRGAEPAHHPA